MVGYLIIETDNMGGDYPDEKFVNIPPLQTMEAAREIADVINKHCSGENAKRYWTVVEDGYKLVPGFEP